MPIKPPSFAAPRRAKPEECTNPRSKLEWAREGHKTSTDNSAGAAQGPNASPKHCFSLDRLTKKVNTESINICAKGLHKHCEFIIWGIINNNFRTHRNTWPFLGNTSRFAKDNFLENLSISTNALLSVQVTSVSFWGFIVIFIQTFSED